MKSWVLPWHFCEPDMVAKACYSSTQEAEAEGSEVPGQPKLHSKNVLQH